MRKVMVISHINVKVMVKDNNKMKVKVMDEVKVQDKVEIQFKEALKKALLRAYYGELKKTWHVDYRWRG